MPFTGRFHQPYRGDGDINPPRRVPLNKAQKSSMRGFGGMLLAIVIVLVCFTFATQNGAIGFITIVGILFLLVLYFAIRDALGIQISTQDNVKTDKKDALMLLDYLAQIEWKQTYQFKHPKEPKWRFRPRFAKRNRDNFDLFFISVAGTIPPILLAYFFGVNSQVSIIGTVIFGFVGMIVFFNLSRFERLARTNNRRK